MSGSFLKECMKAPPPSSPDLLSASGNWRYSAGLGKSSSDTSLKHAAGCGAWGTRGDWRGKSHLRPKPDSVPHILQKGDELNREIAQQVLNDYYKHCYGRSMRSGRSEPPKRVCTNPQGWWVEEGWSNGGKLKPGGDHTKDDSLGKIAPAVEKSQRRSESEGKVRRKADGTYSKGVSDFQSKLCIKENMETLWMENMGEAALGKRMNNMLGTPRSTSCVFCPEAEDIGFHRRERSLSVDSPAGKTTREIARTMRSHNPIPSQSTGTTGNCSPLMELSLQHTVDPRAIRAHREMNERPFVDLCTAFAQIRQASLKDSHRIRELVNPQSSRQFHQLMWWPSNENQNGARSPRSPRERQYSSRSKGATSGYDTPSDAPGSPASWAAGDSPGRKRSGRDSVRSAEGLTTLSPDGEGQKRKHFTGCFNPSFASHDVATALKWVC